MKAFIAALMVLFSISSFAQKAIVVDAETVNLEDVYETHGTGVKKVVLRLNKNTPDSFKVKFKYHYHFTSKQIGSITIGPNGVGDINMTTSSEYFEGKESIKFDISESNVKSGEELELVLEISKPHQNIHSIKVVSSLRDAKGNEISGGRVMLGLLGRKFTVKALCQ